MQTPYLKNNIILVTGLRNKNQAKWECFSTYFREAKCKCVCNPLPVRFVFNSYIHAIFDKQGIFFFCEVIKCQWTKPVRRMEYSSCHWVVSSDTEGQFISETVHNSVHAPKIHETNMLVQFISSEKLTINVLLNIHNRMLGSAHIR